MKGGKEIINEVLEYAGLEAPSFSKSIGVKLQRVYEIRSGRTKKISLSLANKIVEAYPEISKAYLLKGEGSLLVGGAARNIPKGDMAHLSGAGAPTGQSEKDLDDWHGISKTDMFAMLCNLIEQGNKNSEANLKYAEAIMRYLS